MSGMPNPKAVLFYRYDARNLRYGTLLNASNGLVAIIRKSR